MWRLEVDSALLGSSAPFMIKTGCIWVLRRFDVCFVVFRRILVFDCFTIRAICFLSFLERFSCVIYKVTRLTRVFVLGFQVDQLLVSPHSVSRLVFYQTVLGVDCLKLVLTLARFVSSSRCPWTIFSPAVFKNCAEHYKAGNTKSGVYSIDPDGAGAFDVFCDQATDGGGWTVFQKRIDGSVDFYRGWSDYKDGFGDTVGEYWLGLDRINRLTQQETNKLRVDLEDTSGNTAYAEFPMFAVSDENTKYQLSVGTYSG